MRIGVVTFPGSLDDVDAARAARLAGATPVPLWHADDDLPALDAVVLPGGFSYGDYLRCGAIARFAPVMAAVAQAAASGMPVLGICNGFQILCEAHLLPGALTRNRHLHYRNRDVWLRIEAADTAWTRAYQPGQKVLLPIKSGEGRYVADQATLDELTETGRVVARYAVDPRGDAEDGASRGDSGGNAGGGAPRGWGNPNGSLRDIAAICNETGNVVGIMPHPEHAVEALTGPSTDGLGFFRSLLAPAGAGT